MRTRKLVEGRKPNFYIAKSIAQQVEQKADYTKDTLSRWRFLSKLCVTEQKTAK
ncbi:MAG: hypothetical protein U5L45_09565 [Saprospiraceae bacterium]|nr:hypothetical protein [Saprospiraceae bacterium]